MNHEDYITCSVPNSIAANLRAVWAHPPNAFLPVTWGSMGVCDADKQMRLCCAFSSSVSDPRLGPGSGARQAERTSARAASPSIGKHRRFRNATGPRNGAKAAHGYAHSGGEPNSREPEDKQLRRSADEADVLDHS